MSHFDDAKALVQHARDTFKRVEAAYAQSLSEKIVKPSLLIEIKNLMENLRSALDYSAVGLLNIYGSSTSANPRIYFPYAFEGQSQADFQKSRRIESCIPGLAISRPDVAAMIESFQAFADPHNVWLPRFMDLNNENKHQKLDLQVRKETKELKISSGGAGISIGQGA
jgi:hypothetical protein